jgi:uncharacterized protein YyaL (SSP411 family)
LMPAPISPKKKKDKRKKKKGKKASKWVQSPAATRINWLPWGQRF